MNKEMEMQGGGRPDDPLPVSPGPLSPGRTDIDPSREPGTDEIPDNEGEIPLEDDNEGLDPDRVREETDNAVLDKEQDPR